MAVEYFPSKSTSRPSTRISVDTSAITGASSGSEKLVMLIGSATGGKPNTVYKLRNYIQAKDIFRGGELLDALELAWNPSTETAGAGDILAMRVEDATAATLTQGGLTFTSTLYGAEANGITVAYETQTIGEHTSKNLTVAFAKDNYNTTYYNLGDIFTITYDGGAAYSAVEVTATHVKLYAGATEVGATEVSFLRGEGPYVNANVLVNQINAVAGFHAIMPAGSDKNITTDGLDVLTKTAVGTGVTITGIKADIAKQLEYDPYVTVTIGEGAVTTFATTNLVGGSDGTVPESWATKLPEFANEGGYYLVPLTDKAAVHAEALAFVNDRTDSGEPMRVICGGANNETLAQLLARASALRNARATLSGFSATKALANGTVKALPAYMCAALVAGLAAGLPIGEPITFKNINISNLATIFEGQDLDTLNASGVVSAEYVRNRSVASNFRIVDDVTTYNDTTDPVQNQMAIGEANDFLVSDLRIELDNSFIGTRVVNTSASLIKNAVQSFLDKKKRANEIQDYAAEEVQVVINGEVASISMVIFPIRGLKHIEVSLVYNQQTLTA